jgi:hypothetical protein
MKKQWIAIAAVALTSSAAWAGLEQPAPVVVTLNADGSGSANGAQSTARFSKNKVEYIGCGVRRFDSGFVFAFCQASTADEVLGFCETDNPFLIESIGDLDDYSFITFSWGADGLCRGVGNSTQSFYIPN